VVRHLVAEAQRLHPGAITFHYEHALEGVDLASRRLRLARPPWAASAAAAGQPAAAGTAGGAAELLEVTYDLLLGADGAGSLVRAAMAQQLPGVRVQPLPSPSSGAKHRTFHGIAATPAFADWATCSLQLEQPLQVKAAAEDGSWPGKVAWALKADIGGRPARPPCCDAGCRWCGASLQMLVGAWGLAVVGLAAWTWAMRRQAQAQAQARAFTAHSMAPAAAEGIGSPGMGLYLNPDGTLSGSVSMMAGSWDKVGGVPVCFPAA
jgi:hypothetical protein